MRNRIQVSKSLEIANDNRLVLIAGPNVIESEDHTLAIAGQLSALRETLGIEIIFKSSFDKANRSSLNSYRGVGIERGLAILEQVKHKYNMPTITDVHEPDQAKIVSSVVDILQIPAFLCRQTSLIKAVASTGKPMLIKKMQLMSPEEMESVVQKCAHYGNDQVILCERGTMLGYNYLTVDMTSFPIMKSLGCPVAFDVTHSVQLPGANKSASGGRAWAIPHLAKAAVAVGIAALFLEVYDGAALPKCDPECAFPLPKLRSFLEQIYKLDELTKSSPSIELV